MKSLAAWPARHPRAALCIAALAMLLSVLGVRRVHPSASLESMISRDDPAARAAVRVLNDFPAAEELLVMASLPQPEAAADPKNIEPLLDFATRLQHSIQTSDKVASLCGDVTWRAGPEFENYFEKVVAPNGLYFLDTASYEAARARLTKPAMIEQFRRNEALMSAPGPGAAAMAKLFLKDPLRLHEFALDRLAESRPFKSFGGSDAFLSPDGRGILIRIAGKHPPSDLEASQAMTDLVTELCTQANTVHLQIDISGAYAIAAASQRAIRADMISSVVSSVIFLALLFILAYRRPLRLFITGFIPIAIGVLYGFGIYSLFITELTPLTAVIGGILAGMGIDYSIQYISQYQAACQSGRSPVQAVQHTIDSLGSALLAAWATSIVGFIAIGWSKVQALRDFALLGSLGLTGAFAASLFILPAILVLTSSSQSTTPSPRFDVAPPLRYVRKNRGRFIAACILLLIIAGVIAISSGSALQLETDLSVMHPQPNAPLEAQARITQRMGAAPGSLIIYLEAKTPTELIELSHRVRERLASDAVRGAGVRGAYGLSTLLPDPSLIQQRESAVTPAQAEQIITDFREVVAQSSFAPQAFEPYITFLRQLLTRAKPPTMSDLLAHPALAKTVLPREAVTSAKPPTHAITLVFVDKPLDDARTRAAVIGSIRSALAGLDGATLTGLSVIGNDMQAGIQSDLPRLTIIALAIVLLYLFIQLRNLRQPLLALVPTIFSLVLTLAAMHLLGRKLNMINLVTIPLLIGIDVDYAVFIISAARLRRRLPPEMFESQLAASCHAVMMCAATTILGFGSLIFMSVPAVRSLGLAVAIGVLSCLIATLFCLLPLAAPLPASADGTETDKSPAPSETHA